MGTTILATLHDFKMILRRAGVSLVLHNFKNLKRNIHNSSRFFADTILEKRQNGENASKVGHEDKFATESLMDFKDFFCELSVFQACNDVLDFSRCNSFAWLHS